MMTLSTVFDASGAWKAAHCYHLVTIKSAFSGAAFCGKWGQLAGQCDAFRLSVVACYVLDLFS
jgi:hypothetical protein